MENQHYTIIGGGIAGLTAAIALQRIGITAHVYEASDRILPVGAGLGLGINAIKALQVLDLDDEVARNGQPMKSFSILDEQGRTITCASFDSVDNRYGVAIHRAELHAILLSKLDPSTVHTGKRLADIEFRSDDTKLIFEDGSEVSSRYLIVGDGVHSRIRQKLAPKSVPRFAGQTCWRGVAEHPDANGWEPSETWGSKGRFGIVPLTKNRVYWFACVNAERADPRLAEFRASDLIRLFREYHTTIADILYRNGDGKLIHNDVLDVKPIGQYAYGRVVLIGDAAHATTPNLAQGACQAIEDAVVLANCMRKESDVELAFQDFEQRRLERTHWIVNTSWRVGKMAQIENPLLVGLRNTAFRMMPASVSKRQTRMIEEVEFG